MKAEGVAAQLRALRYELGYTQREFAAALGVHIRTLEQWEAGRTSPTYGHLVLEAARRLSPCGRVRLNWREGPKHRRPHRRRKGMRPMAKPGGCEGGTA